MELRQKATISRPMVFVAKCVLGDSKIEVTWYNTNAPASAAVTEHKANRNLIRLTKCGNTPAMTANNGDAILVNAESEVFRSK